MSAITKFFHGVTKGCKLFVKGFRSYGHYPKLLAFPFIRAVLKLSALAAFGGVLVVYGYADSPWEYYVAAGKGKALWWQNLATIYDSASTGQLVIFYGVLLIFGLALGVIHIMGTIATESYWKGHWTGVSNSFSAAMTKFKTLLIIGIVGDIVVWPIFIFLLHQAHAIKIYLALFALILFLLRPLFFFLAPIIAFEPHGLGGTVGTSFHLGMEHYDSLLGISLGFGIGSAIGFFYFMFLPIGLLFNWFDRMFPLPVAIILWIFSVIAGGSLLGVVAYSLLFHPVLGKVLLTMTADFIKEVVVFLVIVLSTALYCFLRNRSTGMFQREQLAAALSMEAK